MQLAKFSIRRSVTITMIYLIIVGFGIFGLTQLKIALYPDMDIPMIVVSTRYQGVGPEDIENMITRPMEEALSSTENVDTISSQSREGVSAVTLEFDWGTDMDQAEIDVRNNIDFVRDALPDDAEEPLVFAINPSMMPILFFSLTSPNLGSAELRNLAEDIVEPMLERVSGVASVNTLGGLERQINVKLNPTLLAAYRLSAEDVVRAIGSGGGLQPAGTIETNTRKFNLRVYSEYRSLAQIENIVLTEQNDVLVRVKDVAEIEDGYEELSSDVRVNSKQGVMMMVSKQSDANTVQTARNVRTILPSLVQNLPQGTQIQMVWDQSESIEQSIKNLSTTAIQAFVLACVVIFIFLMNWRGSLIMSFAMPISVIATFGVLMLADLSLNAISMAGLALAIGMLVDNSIVVLENIFRHREMGENLLEAAEAGTTEVGTAIIASTLTTVAVFLPVLFVPGMTGQLFKDMVLTVSFSLGVSLFVALTLVPMMSSKLLKTYQDSQKARKGFITRIVESILNFINRLYKGLLHWSIHHKCIVLILVIVLFGFSLMLARSLGGEFIPKTDESMLQITLEQAPGIPLSTSRHTAMQLEQIVKEDISEADAVFARFGEQDSGFGGGTSSTIEFYVNLVDKEDRERTQFELADILRKRFAEIPGVSFSVSESSGPSSDSAIELKVIGYDLDKAKQLAEQFKRQMQQMTGFVDLELNMKESIPQLQVHLNQNVLNDFGIKGLLSIAQIISASIEGQTAGTFWDAGDDYDINVRLDKLYRQNRESLEQLMIPVSNDHLVPLSQLGAVEETLSPPTIYRENQERYVSVSCNLSGIDLGTARKQIEAMIASTPLPSDFTVIIGGNAEDQQESNMYLGIAFVVAIVLVYMVMASQFESLLDPFIIMFTVPLSIIGVVLFLYITQTSLSVMALVGIVMLVGIAVNNGIVLVDYMNQLRERGYELYDAVEESGAARMRPVLMTASTTIFGMVPLALELGSGSELWSPLARAVIGGLTSTTLLTLFVVPVLYIIFERLADRVKNVFHRKQSVPETSCPTET